MYARFGGSWTKSPPAPCNGSWRRNPFLSNSESCRLELGIQIRFLKWRELNNNKSKCSCSSMLASMSAEGASENKTIFVYPYLVIFVYFPRHLEHENLVVLFSYFEFKKHLTTPIQAFVILYTTWFGYLAALDMHFKMSGEAHSTGFSLGQTWNYKG